jgi:hypothetical protein
VAIRVGKRGHHPSFYPRRTVSSQGGISRCSLWMPLGGPQLANALDWIADEIMPSLQ